MRKPITGFWWSPTADGVSALVVTAAFFALGTITGCLLAFRATESGAEALSVFLERFLSLAKDGGMVFPDFFQLLWHCVRWPIAAFFMGFSALGLFGVPILSGLRGFFLAFSAASFSRAFGGAGLTAAFLLIGIPAIVAIPAFFLLSVQSFSSACTRAARNSGQGRRELSYSREYFFRCGLCAVALLVSLLLECYLVPFMISDWASLML